MLVPGLVPIGSVAPVATAATPSPACRAKAVQIEERIAKVRADGNERELRGLNKALVANRTRCTTASLERERRQAIEEASAKVGERKAELKAAERKGDPEKVSKQRAKLQAAETELRDAEVPLQN